MGKVAWLIASYVISFCMPRVPLVFVSYQSVCKKGEPCSPAKWQVVTIAALCFLVILLVPLALNVRSLPSLFFFPDPEYFLKMVGLLLAFKTRALLAKREKRKAGKKKKRVPKSDPNLDADWFGEEDPVAARDARIVKKELAFHQLL